MHLLGHYLITQSHFRQTICLCRHVFILLLKPPDIAPAHNAHAYMRTTHAIYGIERIDKLNASLAEEQTATAKEDENK